MIASNLAYFPIFLHFMEFFKVDAASPLATAAVANAAAAQLATEPQPQIGLRFSHYPLYYMKCILNILNKDFFNQTKCFFIDYRLEIFHLIFDTQAHQLSMVALILPLESH